MSGRKKPRHMRRKRMKPTGLRGDFAHPRLLTFLPDRDKRSDMGSASDN